MKSAKTIAATLLAGAVLIGPAHSGTTTATTTTTKVVRDHRGKNSNQQQPPPQNDPGWGNDGGATVRDHRQPPKLPCPLPVLPGCGGPL